MILAACGTDIDVPHEQFRQVQGDASGTRAVRIVAIDVGQGDATLIVSPEREAILIDAGPTEGGGHAVIETLREEGVTELKSVIATHHHEDHTGGIDEVGKYITPTEGVRNREDVSPGDVVELGDIIVDVVAAGGRLEDGTIVSLEPFDENAASLAFVISYAGTRFFVGGDITGGGGNAPYTTIDVETLLAPLVGDIDILRVSHHGSHTSTNANFLAATTPEVAIISVGDGNDYFHPHASVIDRLLDAGIEVYQTERGWTTDPRVHVANGNIVIEINQNGYVLSF